LYIDIDIDVHIARLGWLSYNDSRSNTIQWLKKKTQQLKASGVVKQIVEMAYHENLSTYLFPEDFRTGWKHEPAELHVRVP
jgi:hypothetical protein